LAGLLERDFRQNKPPERLGYMALMTQLIDVEPSSYESVARHKVWQEAMMEEYASIMKNDVWEVLLRPEDKKVVGSKWIYKVKHATDGRGDKYKACSVAKGFSQQEGVDYKETFAPVARYSSILLKILIKKYLGKCFSSPRRLRGDKVPNVDPSHLICEMQIKR
jgi:hypothetical protein